MEARAQLGIAGSALYLQAQQATSDLPGRRTENQRRTRHQRGEFRRRVCSASSTSWGKFRRSIEAADAAYFASIAQYDDLQVLMAAQVALYTRYAL